MAAKLVSSKSETRYASAASWRAMTADDWKRRSVCGEGQVSTSQTKAITKETDLEILCDFTNETLEGELANEELSGLLVTPDFTEGDGSGPEAMGLLDTTSRGGSLASSRGLGGELFTRGLAYERTHEYAKK